MSNLTVGNIKNDDTTQPTDILIAVTSHRNEDSQKIKYSRNSSLVFNSEKPNSTIHEESKNIDYSQQVQKECSSNLAENLKNTQDEKLIQSNELFNEILADTTSLFQTIMIPQSKFLKEHSIKLKQQELKDILNEDEVIHLLFKIWEQEIERVYNGEIQKIKDEIQQKNTVIKKTYEKNKWLTQTTVEIEEKLKTIETEMESSEDFNSDEQSLHKQLKCIIQSILGIEIDSCKEYRVNYEDLSWKIKKKSIQLRHDMDTIGALYNNLAWESQLRRKQNKCFDICNDHIRRGNEYINLLGVCFNNKNVQSFVRYKEQYILICHQLARFYTFSPQDSKEHEMKSKRTSMPLKLQKSNSIEDIRRVHAQNSLESIHKSNFSTTIITQNCLSEIDSFLKSEKFKGYEAFLCKQYYQHSSSFSQKNNLCSCRLCQLTKTHKDIGDHQCNIHGDFSKHLYKQIIAKEKDNNLFASYKANVISIENCKELKRIQKQGLSKLTDKKQAAHLSNDGKFSMKIQNFFKIGQSSSKKQGSYNK